MAVDYAGTSWDLYIGSDLIAGVLEVSPNHEQEQGSLALLNNTTLTTDGPASSSWEVRIADLGQANLAKIIPQNVLAAGTQIPGQPVGTVATTGQGGVVTFGTMDCETVETYEIARLVPCGKPQHTEWLFDAKARLTGKGIEDGVMIYTVTLSSEASGVQSAKGEITLPA